MAGTPDPSGLEPGDRGGPDRAPRRSIVDTWVELFADVGGLVRVEAALARAETAHNLKAVGVQSAKMAAGFALLLMALMFLTVATVVGIAHFLGYLPALLLVTALCAGGGLGLLISGRNRLVGQTILPERVLKRMARDLDRIAERAPPPTPGAAQQTSKRVPAPAEQGAGADAG